MIARFYIFAPFTISIPEGTRFLLNDYEIAGHLVRFHPPKRSEDEKHKSQNTEIKINGTPTIQADVIHIDFIKDGFNREAKPMACDPPHELVKLALDFFTSRLRHVTKASAIRPIEFPNCKWRVRYLNNDESELPCQEGLIKGRSQSAFSLSWIALTDVL